MIYGVVSVRVKPGKLEEFLQLFKSVAPTVREEKGCLEYMPLVDMEIKGVPQSLDKDVVTIIEKWESLEALRAHAVSPHMAEFHKKERDLVEGVSLKMLKEA